MGVDDLLAMADADPAFEAQIIASVEIRINRDKLSDYQPYPKQREFHALGAENSESLFMAANQSMKTFGGSREFAMHMTGKYPQWWTGRRFTKPIRAMAGSRNRAS